MKLQLHVCPTCGEAVLLNPPLFGWAADRVKNGAMRCRVEGSSLSYVHDVDLKPADLNSSDQTPHKCSFCPESFVTSAGREIHEAMHEPAARRLRVDSGGIKVDSVELRPLPDRDSAHQVCVAGSDGQCQQNPTKGAL